MVTMVISDYVDSIVRPVSANKPEGDRLNDDPVFDFIESQMMKVGSLAHGDVAWQEVERAAVGLLESKSKDLKLISYLLQCLQYQSSIQRFSCGVAVLGAFMAEYWDVCHPAPGPRGALPRRRFYLQIMQRFLKSIDTMRLADDPSQWDELHRYMDLLRQQVVAQDLPLDELNQLQSLVSQRHKEQQSQSQANTTVPENHHTAPSNASSTLEHDSSSDKSSKQTLLKVAEFICETPGGMALGLRLRRFAVWFSIATAPENANAKGVTSLMPVSADRIADYESAVERSPDLALLRKIEQSLCLAPFWLDGHYLSARLALKLEQPAWSQAIREETHAFLERLPMLAQMSFKDGSPFASKATLAWLNEEPRGGAGKAQHGGEAEIKDLAQQGGLVLALSALNEQLLRAKEPRDQFYLRLLGADLKHQHKLGALAQSEYQVLLEQANKTALADWEPGLMSRLTQKANIN
ncbi:type VI secretion system protein TssA [Shewanella khirikhana]|uniref:ImpA N-terminal domain-containing protein n=1 Tax=Shewanella khirikhana TaxID=1965282 RepID=A0ABM7DBC8_9GAMM|nr:hypothetical protein STH12_01761 [Shewanella khirikhana]